MKEGLSLDDLAQQLSTKALELNMDKALIVSQNIVTQNIITLYEGIYGEKKNFSFEELLHMRMVEKYLLLGEISFEEAKDLIITLQENYKSFKDTDYEILLIRKFGVALTLIAAVPSEIYTGQGGKLVLKATASVFAEELKLKIELYNKNM